MTTDDERTSWTQIAQGWWSFELRGYRNHPNHATYSLFAYDQLPPLPEEPDEHFLWLADKPPRTNTLTYGDPEGETPDLRRLDILLEELDLELPQAFILFMKSLPLHQRIRSCTACFLELPDYALPVQGAADGYLIHFLSDQQWVLHWYLYIDRLGNQSVLVSENAYGFNLDEQIAEAEDERETAFQLEGQSIWFCAPSFSTFIYRFWLENEIWFALYEQRALNEHEQAYVDHYRRLSDNSR